MNSKQFIEWRELMGFSQTAASHALGIDQRTVGTIEKAEGEIPTRVAIGCARLTPDHVTMDDVQDLLRKQDALLPALFLVVPPFLQIYQGSLGPRGLWQTAPCQELSEWIAANTPSAKISLRTILLPDQRRLEVHVVVFDNEAELVLFELRWL